jgi:hypothetical protein
MGHRDIQHQSIIGLALEQPIQPLCLLGGLHGKAAFTKVTAQHVTEVSVIVQYEDAWC